MIYYKNDIGNIEFVKEIEAQVNPSGQKKKRGLFQCFCGSFFNSRIDHIRNKKILSCGCYKKEKAKKDSTIHGLTGDPIHKLWLGMIARCKYTYYKHYQNKGIKVCDEWTNNFISFYNWAVANGYKKGLSIDRINNNGNYEPNNCRFVTTKENNRNRSSTKINQDIANQIRHFKSKTITAKGTARIFNVSINIVENVWSNNSWT